MTQKNTEQSLVSNSLHSLALIRQAAAEYNNALYYFHKAGFFKYVREGSSYLIEDIYVVPEFRNTPLSRMMMEDFYRFMQANDIFMYYGRVFRNSKDYQKRVNKFLSWGMKNTKNTKYYSIVMGVVK